MDDIVLSALMNLFALFGAVSRIDRELDQTVVRNYLVRNFGIRNYKDYLAMYSDLRDLYDSNPELDKDAIIDSVCTRLQGQIKPEDRFFLFLRFLEFSALNNEAFVNNRALFAQTADSFGLGREVLEDSIAFTAGRNHAHVRIVDFLDCSLKVLKSPGMKKMLVSYHGETILYMNDVPMPAGFFMQWHCNSVIKDNKGNALYYDSLLQHFEAEKSPGRISFCGRHLEFRFPKSTQGLHDFSFDLHSGEMVAIMGGSGTGKTTLISLLNGTLKPDSGHLTLNGKDLTVTRDYIGFVPQDDLLIAELTVYQNLWYTTRFCFDTLAPEIIDHKIRNLIYDLDLFHIKDLKVGSPLDKIISGGQRKRLNIALELIREPAVLFLDEPTSGLSSADSEKVITLLKEQTLKGKLIVANIHQPSTDIYKQFDRLWLLDHGGYPVYDGNPIDAIHYFKRTIGYADAEAATCLSCGNVNPEIILNIIDTRTLDNSGQMTDQRKIEPHEWHERFVKSQTPFQGITEDAMPAIEQVRPSKLKQVLIYLERNIKSKLADKQFILIALLEAPVLAAFVAFLTRYKGEGGYTLLENKNLLSYFFMAIIVAVFMGMSVSAEEIFRDRALLRREKFLRLSYGSYIYSKMIFVAFISLIQTLLFILAGNAIIGIRDLFLVWWIIVFTSAFLSNLIGLLLSQRLKSIKAIYVTIPLLLIPQILLCGLVVPFEDLTRNSKTNNVPVIGDLVPTRWSLEALAVESFTANRYNSKFFETDCRKYQAQYYRSCFLDQLQKSLEDSYQKYRQKEAAFDASFTMLQNELRHLSARWDMKPFSETDRLTAAEFNDSIYSRLSYWMKNADARLYDISNRYNLELDREKKDYIASYGMQALVQEKKRYYNTELEETLLNINASKVCEVKGDVIVAHAGMIYLDPPQKNGRAPFYSHIKVLGSWHLPTFWFNLAVMWIMCTLVGLLLFNGYRKF
jgi:ABC-type multidrug transport system ATPase subunit/ABC-type multidrug transport system permease subunit